MTLSAQAITARLLTLPEQEQQEALDFIEFLQSWDLCKKTHHRWDLAGF